MTRPARFTTNCPLLIAFALAGLVASCDSPQQPSGVAPAADQSVDASTPLMDQQTAFRFRQDFAAPLNADSGWAAAANEPVTVFTDEPFRLRFEVESATADGAQFQLQYRRNDEDWQPMLAENFPQPAKVLRPDLGIDVNSAWQFLSGNADSVSIEEDGEQVSVNLSSNDKPVNLLGRYESLWEPAEFAIDVRLPAGNNTAGILFGVTGSDNYHRVVLSAPGSLSVERVINGQTRLVAEAAADLEPDQWRDLKIAIDGRQASIEYGESLTVDADFAAVIPSSVVGLHVPAGASAAFANLVIEGEPRSPLVSIIASDSFAHGAETTDLLSGSGGSSGGSSSIFIGGSGVSFARATRALSVENSAGRAAEGTLDSGQSEWEWPLVVRRFADGAQTNNNGDRYAFRMVNDAGEALTSNTVAQVTVAVPARHLGGVFVETPARIGPFAASNGDLYFLMEPAETDNMLMAVRSSDGGESWQELDGNNRPATGDLEGFAAVLANDAIYMLHQTSDHVFLHAFHTSDHPTQPDSWAIQDERLASPQEPSTQVADIALRSDGSLVAVYGDGDKLELRVRSADGSWGDGTVVDADQARQLSGPMLVTGRNNTVHMAYTGSDGTAWYRRFEADNRLSPRQLISSELGTDDNDAGAILPLVWLPASDSVSILYRRATGANPGTLWERRVNTAGQLADAVMVSDYAVVQNAVDSDQTGADAIADGQRVQVLFIDADNRHIYHAYTDDDGNWQPATLQVADINAQWVRGSRLDKDGTGPVYGFVYDAGSYGGSGKNRYHEIPLADLPGRSGVQR